MATQSKSDFAKANGFSSSWASNPNTGRVDSGGSSNTGGGTTGSNRSSNSGNRGTNTSNNSARDYIDKSYSGGYDSYVSSQNNRYQQALSKGDNDLVGRLKADAQRVGYSLGSTGGGKVTGNGFSNPNQSAYTLSNYNKFKTETGKFQYTDSYGIKHITDNRGTAMDSSADGTYTDMNNNITHSDGVAGASKGVTNDPVKLRDLASQFGYNTNYDAKTGNITFTNDTGLSKTLKNGQYNMLNDSASLPMSQALAMFGGSYGYDNQMVKNGGYGWQYGVEPKREDFKTLQEYYDADNKYVQSLLENPNMLPSAVGNYQLTLPTAGISRSTDVYGRIIDGNSIKWLGRDGSQLWSTFAPNTNWHQTGSGSDDKELGDAYSRNLSRFASQTIFKRGDNIGQTPSTLDGVSYDGGKAYQQYQDDLVNKYSKLQMNNPWAQALKGNDQGNNVQTAKAVATQVNSPATAQTAVTETAPATLASQKAVQQAVQQPQTVYTTNANALKDIGIRDFGNAYGYDVGWNGTSPYLTKNGQVFNFGQNDFTTKDGRSYMSGDMADLLLGNGNTSYLGEGATTMEDAISKYTQALAKESGIESRDDYEARMAKRLRNTKDSIDRDYTSSRSALDSSKWKDTDAMKQQLIANGLGDSALLNEAVARNNLVYNPQYSDLDKNRLNAVSEAENNNMDAISDWEKSMSTLKAQLAQKAYDMYNSDRQFNWESSMNNPQNKYMMSQIANNNIQADKWNMEKGTYGQMLQANLQKAQMENEWYPKMSQAQINNLNYHPPVGGGNGPSVGDIIKAQEYGQYQKQQSYLNGLDPKRFVLANGNVNSLLNNFSADMVNKGGISRTDAGNYITSMLQTLGMPSGALQNNATYTAWRNSLPWLPKQQTQVAPKTNWQSNLKNNYDKTFGLMMR